LEFFCISNILGDGAIERSSSWLYLIYSIIFGNNCNQLSCALGGFYQCCVTNCLYTKHGTTNAMVLSKIIFVKDVLRLTSFYQLKLKLKLMLMLMLMLDMERIWHPLLVRVGANTLKLSGSALKAIRSWAIRVMGFALMRLASSRAELAPTGVHRSMWERSEGDPQLGDKSQGICIDAAGLFASRARSHRCTPIHVAAL
jgi:hypothetical protein